MGIVSTGRQPTPLDETEIDSIRILLANSLSITPHAYLQVGDKVVISDGPLNGASGYIVKTETARFVVSISLLQRSVSVELSGDWLKKVSETSKLSASATSIYAAPKSDGNACSYSGVSA
jgi:transcription antitermination factor NusG